MTQLQPAPSAASASKSPKSAASSPCRKDVGDEGTRKEREKAAGWLKKMVVLEKKVDFEVFFFLGVYR